MPIVYLAVGWLAGIYLGSVLAVSPLLLVMLAAGGGAVFLLGQRVKLEAAYLLGAAILTMTLGLWRYDAAIPRDDPGQLTHYHSYRTAQIVRATVNAPTEVRGDELRLHLTARAVWLPEGKWQPVSGGLLVSLSVSDTARYRYGDLLELYGTVTPPASFGGNREYMLGQGIASQSRQPDLKLVAQEPGLLTGSLANLYDLRAAAAGGINQRLTQPEGALLTGILLGDRAGMPGWLVDDFAASGTAHVVAISGQNMAYILGLFFWIADWRKLPRRRYALPAVVAIVIYTICVGGSASVVRSAIMAGVVALALLTYRDYTPSVALSYAAIGMTLFNPYYLWDIGWQLSFVAIIGLVYVAPLLMTPIEPLLKGRLKWLTPAIALFMITLGVQLTTEPLIWFHFGQISLIAPLANLFIEPLLPLIMGLGALTLPLLFVWPLALPLVALTWLCLRCMILLVEFFARLPFAMLTLPEPSVWWLVAYYSLLTAGVVWAWQQVRPVGVIRGLPVEATPIRA